MEPKTDKNMDNLVTKVRVEIGLSLKEISKISGMSETKVASQEKLPQIEDKRLLNDLTILLQIDQEISKPDKQMIDPLAYNTAILLKYYSGNNRYFSHNEMIPDLKEIKVYISQIFNETAEQLKKDPSLASNPFFPKSLGIVSGVSPLIALGSVISGYSFPTLLPNVTTITASMIYGNLKKRKIQSLLINENRDISDLKILLLSTSDIGITGLLSIYRYLQTKKVIEKLLY